MLKTRVKNLEIDLAAAKNDHEHLIAHFRVLRAQFHTLLQHLKLDVVEEPSKLVIKNRDEQTT
jgi:hypothetical protein